MRAPSLVLAIVVGARASIAFADPLPARGAVPQGAPAWAPPSSAPIATNVYAPPPPPPPAPKRKTALLATGIALTGFGVVAGVLGVWMMGAANGGQLGPCGASKCTASQQRWIGAIVGIVGGLSVSAGVPLIVVGARAPAPIDPPVAGLTLRRSF